MKIYFDNIIDVDYPNCKNLSKKGSNDFWLTSPGTRLKRELNQLGIPFYNIDILDDAGLYFVEVNGDPIWWCGLCTSENGPTHLLSNLPNNIIELLKNKKIRLVISADREGGGMIWNGRDGFLSTTQEMKKLGLPPGCIFIMQGNKKITEQYESWLSSTKNDRMFAVAYVNHFDRIFINSINELPSSPLVVESVKNKDSYDYNSLNRSYKDHRMAHLFHIASTGMLDHGLVSANEIRLNQLNVLSILKKSNIFNVI